ncbi:MAG: hypothetical protein AB9903_31760 [Vulcanimicrobiota bacterium]
MSPLYLLLCKLGITSPSDLHCYTSDFTIPISVLNPQMKAMPA